MAPLQVFHDIASVAGRLPPTAVALGNFDGVHRGHQALLRRFVADARRDKLVPAVLTFFPHPVEVLRPGTRLERLTTTEEKLVLLEQLGIEAVLVEKFRPELAALTPEQFFALFLEGGFAARRVHVGFNFRFGKDRAGDTKLLAALCASRGLSFFEEPAFEEQGAKVSSTEIRRRLAEGDMEGAQELLGRPFTISGQVDHGDHRGTQLGFPTANVRTPWGKCIPRHGVYFTRTVWQRESYRSVTNVGLRPSVQPTAGLPDLRVETHLLEGDRRLYGETLTVEFLHFLREERRFPSLEALKEQIAVDVAAARAYSFPSPYDRT